MTELFSYVTHKLAHSQPPLLERVLVSREQIISQCKTSTKLFLRLKVHEISIRAAMPLGQTSSGGDKPGAGCMGGKYKLR